MKLRKDDPIYYRNKISDLMNQSLKEGLDVEIEVFKEESIKIGFRANNGDFAQFNIISKKGGLK